MISPTYSMMKSPRAIGFLARMPNPLPSVRKRSMCLFHPLFWMRWLVQASPAGQRPGVHSVKTCLQERRSVLGGSAYEETCSAVRYRFSRYVCLVTRGWMLGSNAHASHDREEAKGAQGVSQHTRKHAPLRARLFFKRCVSCGRGAARESAYEKVRSSPRTALYISLPRGTMHVESSVCTRLNKQWEGGPKRYLPVDAVLATVGRRHAVAHGNGLIDVLLGRLGHMVNVCDNRQGSKHE